jgi:ribonucleoside-triphosphate reductase
MLTYVTKRDKRRRNFNPKHIYDAITAAFRDSKERYTEEDLDNLVSAVVDSISANGVKSVSVEKIQNTIERTLMTSGFLGTAKAFITYRAERTRIRDLDNDLNRRVREIIDANLKTSSLLRDNGNVNGALVASSYAKAGGETMKMYNLLDRIKPEIARAHKCGDIHIHDLDYYSLTVNCFFIPLAKLLADGFDTGNGWVRPANSIETACAIGAIALQTSQNAFFGGQAFANFDFELAPYVNRSFQKNLKRMIRDAIVFAESLGTGEPGDLEALRKIREKYDLRLFKDVSTKDLTEFVSAYNGELDDYECGREPLPELPYDEIDRNFVIDLGDGTTWQMPDKMVNEADMQTVRNTFQGLESFVHNVNSLFSRSGNQLPFSSVNFGLDTSKSGRLVSFALLHATEVGIGNGATAIFPISICKEMAGYTINPGDPNYDIWEKSCEVLAERFYPNFVNVDAPYNKIYVKYDEKETEFNPDNLVEYRGQKLYRVSRGVFWEFVSHENGKARLRKLRPETTISTMGCRTRSIGNVNGESVTVGKGNLWFTTINLPAIAIRASKTSNPIESFWAELDDKMKMCRECMEERYKQIRNRTYANLYFPMKNGLYMGADKDAPVTTTIEKAIRNGSNAIGYIGIYEVCLTLLGKVFGVDDEATKFGYDIVKHIREYTDAVQQETHMNWTTFATPAENVCGRFAQIDAKRFGNDDTLHVPGDELWGKGYYTNSHMMPFDVQTTLKHKLEVEAPFHELTNGGHIFYYKIDGDPSKNVEAVKAAVRAMYDAGIGYGTITFSQDTCRECGYRGIIDNECPHCHAKDNGENVLRIRRITGYLVGRSSQSIEESWGDGKLAELKRRKNI